jgi:hypothetical protein
MVPQDRHWAHQQYSDVVEWMEGNVSMLVLDSSWLSYNPWYVVCYLLDSFSIANIVPHLSHIHRCWVHFQSRPHCLFSHPKLSISAVNACTQARSSNWSVLHHSRTSLPLGCPLLVCSSSNWILRHYFPHSKLGPLQRLTVTTRLVVVFTLWKSCGIDQKDILEYDNEDDAESGSTMNYEW